MRLAQYIAVVILVDGQARADRVGEFSAELRPVFEGVRVAQHEIAVVTVNVGERTKPVVLHLKEPIGMVEGLRKAQERHGPEWLSRSRTDAE